LIREKDLPIEVNRNEQPDEKENLID